MFCNLLVFRESVYFFHIFVGGSSFFKVFIPFWLSGKIRAFSYNKMDLLSVMDGRMKVKVSSVLNRSSDFQAKHMFTDDDLCWNSSGAEPGEESTGQWLLLEFLGDNYVDIKEIHIQFQGGFVGTEGIVQCGLKKGDMKQACVLDHIKSIDDSNDLQIWKIPNECNDIMHNTKFLRIFFPASTDFFGRVTIYRLMVFGTSHS